MPKNAQEASNMLMKGQHVVPGLVDTNRAVPIELRPGQFTVHAFRCVHGSGTVLVEPNARRNVL
jgi:hypothetical protein